MKHVSSDSLILVKRFGGFIVQIVYDHFSHLEPQKRFELSVSPLPRECFTAKLLRRGGPDRS